MADSAGYADARRHPRSSARPRLEMDDEQYADWTRLLAHRAGVFITPERRSFLISGVRARMRETDCVTTREYYERMVSNNAGETEWALLIDRLTVHETCFFRHRSSMTLVGEQLVPEAIERGREYTAWSFGCASGEEVYSLAMLIDTCRTAGGETPGFRVTGTDISLPALQQAREGVYLQRRLRDIPVAMQYRYCRKTSGTHFQVVDKLRRRVCFSRLNLRDLAASSMEEVDLIYCQNLLIYYDRQSRVEMVDQLATFLRPGGVLVLGPGELLDWRNANMEKVRYPDTLAYRRTN